jgi:hypothetical protein
MSPQIMKWYLKRFSFHEELSEMSYMYLGLVFLFLNKLEFHSHILVSVSNAKFNDSAFREGHVVSCGW